MNHRTFIGAVARRFPDLTQRQIEEVLAVMVEIWQQELAQPKGEIIIRDFGAVRVEVQQLRASGVIRQQLGSAVSEQVTRLYVRFRPAAGLRAVMKTHFKEGK